MNSCRAMGSLISVMEAMGLNIAGLCQRTILILQNNSTDKSTVLPIWHVVGASFD